MCGASGSANGPRRVARALVAAVQTAGGQFGHLLAWTGVDGRVNVFSRVYRKLPAEAYERDALAAELEIGDLRWGLLPPGLRLSEVHFSGAGFEAEVDAMQVDLARIRLTERTVELGRVAASGVRLSLTGLPRGEGEQDAAATAIGNLVQSITDIEFAIAKGKCIDKIRGIIIIVGEKMGIWGDLEVVPLKGKNA